MSLSDMCELFLEQNARGVFNIAKAKLEKNEFSDSDAELLVYSVHSMRSASGGYCVYGDYDMALSILDELKAANQFVQQHLSELPSFIVSDIEKLLAVPVDEIKTAISENRSVLAAFFQRLAYDPGQMKLFAEQQKDTSDFMREGFRAVIDKHLERVGVNEDYRNVLGEYFTDAVVLAMVNMKKSVNRIVPKTVVYGLSSNPRGWPSLEGGMYGLSSVEGIEGYELTALYATEFYGRCPDGTFLSSPEMRDESNALIVHGFSMKIGSKAAELAKEAGRKFVEEHDVVRAYDLVPNGGKEEVHAAYLGAKRINETFKLMAEGYQRGENPLDLPEELYEALKPVIGNPNLVFGE